MGFVKDQKNASVIIIIAALAIIGCVGSCVYFLGNRPSTPIATAPMVLPQAASGTNGQPKPSGMPGPSQSQ